MSERKPIKSVEEIDYKNLPLLKSYISRYGKIVPRQYTKITLKQQKRLAQAIKNARFMALLPYIR
jgi:small subunit ribosomal protein S18